MLNKSPNSRSIFLFCASIFFFWIALYFYTPVLPVYVASFGVSLSMVGTVVSAYAVPQLILRIPLGLWFDALKRRKPVVAVGIVAAIVGAIGLGLSPGPWFLFISRIITGLGAAAWVVFVVYLAGYYRKEETGKAMGLANFVQGISLVVATSTGGLAADVWGIGYTFFGAALVGILALVVLLPVASPEVQLKKVSLAGFSSVFTNRLLLKASLMSALITFAGFSGVYGFTPIYGAKIGASHAGLGIISMLAVGASAVASLATVWVVKKRGNRFTILLGGLLMGVTLLSIPFTSHVYQLMLVQVFHGLGQGVLRTVFMTLSLQELPVQQRATAMGVFQAMYSIGMLLGPLISGFLADSQGLDSVFYLSAALCLVVAVMSFLPRLPAR